MMVKLKVLPLQAVLVIAVGETVRSGGVTTGRSAVPSRLCSCAVVCTPVASTIEKVSGSTHVPLVTALNEPPLVFTMGLSSVTAFGNVDDTRYGGVPRL